MIQPFLKKLLLVTVQSKLNLIEHEMLCIELKTIHLLFNYHVLTSL